MLPHDVCHLSTSCQMARLLPRLLLCIHLYALLKNMSLNKRMSGVTRVALVAGLVTFSVTAIPALLPLCQTRGWLSQS